MSNLTLASAGGASPAANETAHVASAGRVQPNHRTDDPHFAIGVAEDKGFSTWRAKLPLAGHELHRTAAADGPSRFFVTRWGHIRELRGIEAVVAFALHVGAAS